MSGSDEAPMWKRKWIALETLFTFCPPEPCARIAFISISFSIAFMATAILLGFSIIIPG
jgi:hypothetical protein